ncbi:hypothetical protein TorRG33x02_087060 [Trema orientale]|uniref:Uncharacterized protein n=1 Tax=Trema orientale TaxID=63057 RepID=A0A2P5FCN7_TREOI|nr:hypothetical protein TorRG33x02_087060 [Trema orientale]
MASIIFTSLSMISIIPPLCSAIIIRASLSIVSVITLFPEPIIVCSLSVIFAVPPFFMVAISSTSLMVVSLINLSVILVISPLIVLLSVLLFDIIPATSNSTRSTFSSISFSSQFNISVLSTILVSLPMPMS